MGLNPKEFYLKVVESVDERLCKDVLSVLAEHVGRSNSVTIQEIAWKCCGTVNATTVRKVRRAIELLRTNYFIPIVGLSQEEGRWIAESEEELFPIIQDIEHRISSLSCVLRSAKMSMFPPKTEISECEQYTLPFSLL